MSWTVSTFTVVIFGGGVLAMAIGLVVLRKRPDPMAWPLALLMFAVTAWATPHAISLGYTDVERVAFWHRMRYPGTVFAPVLYLVVALRYAGRERMLSRRAYAGLVVVPVLTIVIVWTNQYHGLFWESLSVASVGEASVLVPEFGPWYWVNLGYLYLITVVGLVTLLSIVLRSNRLYRKQAGLMFVGGVVPLTTNGIINFAGGRESMIDFTTTALAVSGITFALALFYLDLLELRPVARDRLVEELDDGVVAVGPDERIQDFNPTAKRILDDVAVGEPAGEALPANVASGSGELAVQADGRERLFRTRTTRLTDERGRAIGRIVYLNDVTEIAEREQRISVLNRVLRHNIRNELNVAAGRLESLELHPSTDEEHVEASLEAIRNVVEFAAKARYVEQTLHESGETETVPVATIAERVVGDARERYSDAVIEYVADFEPDTAASVRVADGELFETALGELVENAVVHSDRESPNVTVRVESAGDRIRVNVADDGPGIPAAETEALADRTETSLRHGSGLGLWLVRWTVSLSGGELSFAENDPRGCAVTLTLRAALDEEATGAVRSV